MWRRWALWRCLVVVAAMVLAVACGDSADGESAPTTTTAVTTPAASGKLPDACGLIDDAAAGAAMAGTVASKSAPQPPTDVSSRCEWKGGGIYSLSLLVQRGTTAKSSFDNTVSGGFVSPVPTLAGADTRVRLGARETARDYRLVSVAAYNGTYYVYYTIQGRDRADDAATTIATGLIRDALKKLTG